MCRKKKTKNYNEKWEKTEYYIGEIKWKEMILDEEQIVELQ